MPNDILYVGYFKGHEHINQSHCQTTIYVWYITTVTCGTYYTEQKPRKNKSQLHNFPCVLQAAVRLPSHECVRKSRSHRLYCLIEANNLTILSSGVKGNTSPGHGNLAFPLLHAAFTNHDFLSSSFTGRDIWDLVYMQYTKAWKQRTSRRSDSIITIFRPLNLS